MIFLEGDGGSVQRAPEGQKSSRLGGMSFGVAGLFWLFTRKVRRAESLLDNRGSWRTKCASETARSAV